MGALAVLVIDAVSVTGPGLTSEFAVAVLVTVLPSSEISGRARTVTVAVALAAIVPSAQEMVVVSLRPGAVVQVPCVLVYDA